MSNKKSYMSTKNILNEGWFKNLARVGAVLHAIKKQKKKTSAELAKKLKSKSGVKAQISKLNASIVNLEKIYSDLYGTKVKLDKFNISDFLQP